MSYICFCVYEDDSTLRIQFLRKIAVYILIQERYFLELLTKRLYVIYTYQTGEQIKLRLFLSSSTNEPSSETKLHHQCARFNFSQHMDVC